MTPHSNSRARRHSRFDVWAPNAERVDLVHGDIAYPMTPAGHGWWSAGPNATEANATGSMDMDYGYVLHGNGERDGSKVLPDPRSRRQPDGVHGLSCTFDPSAFRWGDDAWTGRQLAGSVIYELHVGTFTPAGTLDAAIDKLDHLLDIGIDFVELLPVNAFNGTHNWGYDGVLWYAVHEGYGGPAAYQRFVNACHRRGLGVIQDVVYNHLGPSGNYLPQFGPYLHDDQTNTWGSGINLDGQGSDEVRRYICDNALMWLDDYHVDALRLDAVHALIDHSREHVLKQMSIEVDALSAFVGRPLSLIAESDLNDSLLITPREAGGYGISGQWSDDFHHGLHVALAGETTGYYADFAPLSALAKVLTKGFYHDGTMSTFRGTSHGHPLDTTNMPAWRLVVCSQNHDQIGNRASGDRLTAGLDDGQLTIAAVMTLLGPFTPMLFMGEEWAASTPWQFFTSHPEPELGKATADGRIEEFARMGWDPATVPDPQDPATFERSHLDWSEVAMGRHTRLLETYRRLTTLRRSRPEFTDPRFGALSVEFDGDAGWLFLYRSAVVIAINFADTPITLPVDADSILFASTASIQLTPGAIALPARSVAVLE